MKKLFVIIPLAAMLLLSGCGHSAMRDQCEGWLAEQSQRESFSFTAELTAEYPDGVASFTMSCEEGKDGCTVQVIEPEIVRGIKAHMKTQGDQLEFDGVVLDVPGLDKWGLTPVSALPELICAVRQGYLADFGRDDGMLMLTLTADDTLSVLLGLDEAMTPVYCEFISEGHSLIHCNITDWK